MRRIPFIIVPFTLAATLLAQPRLTLDYSAMAKRLVQQLALKPGDPATADVTLTMPDANSAKILRTIPASVSCATPPNDCGSRRAATTGS